MQHISDTFKCKRMRAVKSAESILLFHPPLELWTACTACDISIPHYFPVSSTHITHTHTLTHSLTWTAVTCNDMKSSTKSVFGTAAGVFLDEYRDTLNLETPLVGTSRENSLIPQIWEQPLTDDLKELIKVKHVLSMTSGLETPEPWLPSCPPIHYPEYSGPHQMYEYCFGWWHFAGVPSLHSLKFEPGADFNYSNYGLEQFALAMRNISGEMVLNHCGF